MKEPDQLTDSKTIFDVGPWEIFWRNFLAGVSRALGGLVLYFIFAIVMVNIFTTYIWPIVGPQFESFDETLELLKDTQNLPGYSR